MNKLVGIAIAGLAAPLLVYSQDEPVSIPTRFGELKTDSEGVLQFNGRPITPELGLFIGDEAVATYKLDSSDVVLIHVQGGTSCPGRFVFVTVSQQEAKVTPYFGTCYDEDIAPQQIGQTIAFSMKKIGGRGLSRYVYKQGLVFEDGKPVK
jgi:hypothetical protein